MKSVTTKLLTAASVLALSSTAVPAMAWGGYENYTRVPLQGYLPYNNYGGYGYHGYGYNGYGYNGYGGYPGYVNGYGGNYGYGGYNPYYRARRVLKTTLIGAGIGAGAGALYGLSSRRGRILRPALIGGGIGAGIGLGYGLLTQSHHNYYY
jgi:hypothetical protein